MRACCTATDVHVLFSMHYILSCVFQAYKPALHWEHNAGRRQGTGPVGVLPSSQVIVHDVYMMCAVAHH
jgi:hypothetical protein